MKVGLDALTLRPLNLSPFDYILKLEEYGLEGMQYFSQEVRAMDPDTRKAFAEEMAAKGLYLELTGSGVNPGRIGKSVDELVEAWKPLFPLAKEVNATILNTCFGLLKERTLESPTMAEQVAFTTEVLRRLAPMAADHDVTVTMELHVDLTSKELASLIEAVDSPYVQVNMDTANPLGLLEDPIEATRILAPYAKTTHYKDTCVFPAEGGYIWLGGAPLGTGLVDLPAVTEILYAANPDIHLNIEDGIGYIPIPMEDEAFLASFPELRPADLVKFLQFLRKGEAQLRAGMHPRPEDFKSIDVPQALASRLWHSAAYCRKLRDEIAARQQAT